MTFVRGMGVGFSDDACGSGNGCGFRLSTGHAAQSTCDERDARKIRLVF